MNQDLKPFLQSIQLNNKMDYVAEVTVLSWEIYKSKEDQNDNLKRKDFLLRCYGSRLASIAYAYCSEKSPWKVTHFDIRIHLHWYLELEESFTDDNSSQFAEIKTAFSGSKLFKDLNVDEALSGIHLAAFMSRLMRSQWDNRKATMRGAERRFSILNRWMRKTNHTEMAGRIQKRIRIFSGMELDELIKNAFAIYAFARGSRPSGVIIPPPDNFFEKLEIYGIDRDKFESILTKWSWNIDELKNELNSTFRETDNLDYKYFPSPLAKLPILEVSQYANRPMWLIPSPWDYITKISHSCSDLFTDILEKDDVGPFFGELGEEYALWMKDFCIETYGEMHVIDLDLYRDTKSKIADVVLVDGNHAIIVEFKRSLGSYLDKTYLAPANVVKILEEIHDAFLQIEATKKIITSGKIRELENVTEVAHVVCCDQTILQEGTMYMQLYLNSALKDQMTIDPLTLVDSDEFEKYIKMFSIPDLVTRIRLAMNGVKDPSKGVKNPYAGEEKDFESTMYDNARSEIMPWIDEMKKRKRGE